MRSRKNINIMAKLSLVKWVFMLVLSKILTIQILILFRCIITHVIKGYWFSTTTPYYGKTCLFILLEIWINRWNNNYCKYCIAKKSHCCSFDYENIIFDLTEYLVYQLECRLRTNCCTLFYKQSHNAWVNIFCSIKLF